MRRGAFTLIEVMIAVAVLGVLTAAAVLSFASPLRDAQFRDAVDLIRAGDADARIDAKHFDQRVKLVYDAGHGRFERRDSGDHLIARGLLPGSVRIDEIRIAGERNFGVATVSVSQLGFSQTYAVRLVSHDREQWLCFAGLSGQVTVFNNESEVANIFKPR